MSDEGGRTYAGRPVAQRRVERRQQFFDAALSVFTEKSYAKSSVSDVCARAGLSRRQFYAEFDSREALLVEVYRRIQDDARDAVSAVLSDFTPGDLPDVAEVVRVILHAYVESIGMDLRRARLAFVEIVGVSEEVEQLRIAARESWIELVRAMLDGLGLGADPLGGWAMAGAAFIGAVNAAVHCWATTNDGRTTDELVEMLAQVFLTVIAPSRP